VTINELGRKRGLEYLFDRYKVDALVFTPELGSSLGIVAALGYVAVRLRIGLNDGEDGADPPGHGANGLLRKRVTIWNSIRCEAG
jgi:hypothetical protein